MATYTPNYGLHQWVPEDNFLREDFNEDFQKIDTALAEKADNGSTSSSISSLQSQLNQKASVSALNSLSATVNTKCRVVVGTYTGTGRVLSISLGGQPQMVLLIYGFDTLIAIQTTGKNGQLSLTSSGFTVNPGSSGLNFNFQDSAYQYVAFL